MVPPVFFSCADSGLEGTSRLFVLKLVQNRETYPKPVPLRLQRSQLLVQLRQIALHDGKFLGDHFRYVEIVGHG
jgi:hypothetical protein